MPVNPMSHPSSAEEQFYFRTYIWLVTSSLMIFSDSKLCFAYVDLPDLLTRTSRAFSLYLDPIDRTVSPTFTTFPPLYGIILQFRDLHPYVNLNCLCS